MLPSAPRMHDVVDGQQRLITLTILLCVIRDIQAETGGAEANSIDRLVWAGRMDSGRRPSRIVLNGPPADFLRTYVQEAGGLSRMPGDDELSPGEERILAVREHFAEALVGRTADELDRLARYTIENCYFSAVTTHSLDRAHRLFNVLNNRGRPLARNDILKTQLLAGIPAARRAQFGALWAGYESRLGDDFETLFSHIRLIEGRRGSRVIAGITDLVEASGGAEAFFKTVLEPYAAIYDALLVRRMPGPDGAKSMSRSLTYLGWLGGQDWVPAAMLYWRQSNGDAALVEAFLERLERLSYGLRLLGLGADKRQARLAAVTRAVREGSVLEAGSPLDLTREELRNIHYNLRGLHARSQLTAKLVLLRLNDEIAGRPQALDPGDYTVEHVLPQKPGRTSAWRIWFANGDERAALTQSLGNLVLVTRSENERARNAELERKLAVYFANAGRDALAITRELMGVETWRADQIRAREERLIALIDKVWRLDASAPMAEHRNGRGKGSDAGPAARRTPAG